MDTKDKIRSLHLEIGERYAADMGRLVNGDMPPAFASPIEELLHAAMVLKRMDWDHGAFGRLEDMPDDHARHRFEWFKSMGVDLGRVCMSVWSWHVIREFEVGSYRVDFAFLNRNGNDPLFVAVECDGHAFHERTKEQVARDKKRDRFFQQAGWRVLRFSGSEIYRDPFKCVDEVFSLLSKIDGIGWFPGEDDE